MTKAYSCVGEQQFNAYPILDDLRKCKDYVNQFGKPTTAQGIYMVTEGRRSVEVGYLYRSE